MAKKRPTKEDGEHDHVHAFKLRMTAEEMRIVRVAAAIGNERPGVFARQVVLERAREIIAEFREEP